jgi:4-amino-4-deoxy-L-arabinose transferase-like glycosyltransferase
MSLSLRLWLLDKRWINPDEGAHLMDAVLALDGQIPGVDYASRQPLYIYTIAGFLKLLGINYVSGRLLSLTCSMLVGFAIFLLARLLFDEKVALLSAAVYWMLPLELMNSVIVKTEPLVTLLVCLSLYVLILFSRSKQALWLVLAGIFAAMGFYVRQSALILPLTVFGFLSLFHRGLVRETAKSFGFFLVGYCGVLLIVLLYYSEFMSVQTVLMGDLSPFGFLASAMGKLSLLLGMSSQETNGITTAVLGLADNQYSLYYRYIRQAISMHSFLLVGLGFSIMTLCRQHLSSNKLRIREDMISYSLLYLWIFSLFIAYTYYFKAEAFYIDYFREFLPPLVILLCAWLLHSVSAFEKNGVLERFILGGVFVSIIWFFIQSNYKTPFGGGASLTIALFTLFTFVWKFESSTRRLVFISSLLAIAALILLARQPLLQPYLSGTLPKLVMVAVIFSLPLVLLGKKVRPTLNGHARFMSISIVLGAFALSLSSSAAILNLAYDSPYSPQSLEKTSAYLKKHTQPTDTVMSGAVIWELQAQRRPFLNISHPLKFEPEISEEEKEALEFVQRTILTHPPKVIILDGYTERTYLRRIPWLTDLLNTAYTLVITAGPARYPIEVYQLRRTEMNYRPGLTSAPSEL